MNPTKSDSTPKHAQPGGISDTESNVALSDIHTRLPDPQRTSGKATALDRWLMRTMLQKAGNPKVEVVLWDNTSITTSPTSPAVRLFIHQRSTLYKMLIDPSLAFGDGYSQGIVEVEGGLIAFNEAIDQCTHTADTKHFYRDGIRSCLGWLQRNTIDAARSNIHHHYDIGNDFYKLWLDQQLAYTCAYFSDPEMSLEAAQIAKMDHVCRKVGLKPGDTVVEAGCGWGALALHMAKFYGAKVRAFNISHEQIVYARERAQQEGLSDRVEFVEDDWRNITGSYDSFVSVGMLEHVGLKNYETLGKVIAGCQSPRGRGLIHSIGCNSPRMLDSWTTKRIFPGAHVPSLSQMMQIFEPQKFSILDVENIRLHYAMTLEHWLHRYEQNIDRVTEMFDEDFIRTWRLYLAASVAAFRAGSLQLFQVVFTNGGNNEIPWTRAGLYQAEPSQTVSES
ncbi:Cyclopropane-fatty-acyl-phospholipid synthase [Gimesia alba]|uniref:Cyclopropane-fatty-acyl-phospholipid synthase n=1 Tax=Gimesia alba TaxID=2527973 RepID=A0A517RFE6_9PLAN|nr:cyclopropane-fatty-acyl-phospholipid synthase family protein [Gimesia alba]QDT42598.1 Cyclopropane-fatty-acyl-phospholipid synthase [Gimesia alba]